jgi:solute carrier family 25 carnitine/acylcarnitine transporter 20/29
MSATPSSQEKLPPGSSLESISSFQNSRLPSTMMTVNATSALNSAAAGYVAGVTGVVFGHPLDSAKVWLQTNTAGKNKHFLMNATPTPSTGTSTYTLPIGLKRPVPTVGTAGATLSMSTLASATRPFNSTNHLRTVANTVRALYSGVSGPLLTVGIVQSINFATYDTIRQSLHRRDHPNALDRDYIHKDSLTNVAVAGFVAGTGLAFVTSPLIMIKTRQQITGHGFRQACRETLLRNGRISLSGGFVGFYPHLLSETIGRALYYAVYEGCKRSVADYKERHYGDSEVTLKERMLSAGFAGISCWALIFPFDSLRSRLYQQEGRISTTEMIKRMHAEKAFYRGFWLTVLRAGPVAAAVLPVYDLVLEKLSTTSSS